MDRLERALARADRQSGGVAVLFHDRDNFKLVNDSLGHQEGDQLLVEISGRLLATVRMADTAAGLGGDEFAILLDEVSCPEETYQVAERIASSLRAPVDLQGREVFVSASVGIALSSPGDRPDNLLRNADMAMYRAKAGGRARCVLFDACLEVGAVERLELETDLATALTP